MIQREWTDCDLTRVVLSEGLGQLTIELSNNYDGETMALLVCKGLLSVTIRNALPFHDGELPVFVGKVELSKFESRDMIDYLHSNSFGFSRCDMPKPLSSDGIWRVHIEGGEIDFEAFVKECQVM